MPKARIVVLAALLLATALTPTTASAGCQGVICGGICGLDGFDFCIYVHGGNEMIGCKNVSTAGCMSMVSPVCCPRVPLE